MLTPESLRPKRRPRHVCPKLLTPAQHLLTHATQPQQASLSPSHMQAVGCVDADGSRELLGDAQGKLSLLVLIQA